MGATLLQAFLDAGVVGPEDVAFAAMLERRTRPTAPEVLLAAALACRAPRNLNVCVGLRTAREALDPEGAEPGAAAGAGGGRLPWPEPEAWIAAVAAADHLVGDGLAFLPLVLEDDRVYLRRAWTQESALATALRDRAASPAPPIDEALLAAGLALQFPASPEGDVDWQRVATETALRRRLTVITGGPGTGKTTTLKRIVALVAAQARAADPTAHPAVLLLAPTGKAAVRMREALRPPAPGSSDRVSLPPEHAALLDEVAPRESTIHRALGVKGGNLARFWRSADDPLVADLVIVDEVSMVDLSLMAKLIDAVPPDARLVLVGDRHQLASVEAGAVLADLCAAADSGEVGGGGGVGGVGGVGGGARPGIGACIVDLRKDHRFGGGSGIATLAGAIRRGDVDGALAVLADPETPDVELVEPEGDGGFGPVSDRVLAAYAPVIVAALEGRGLDALRGLDQLRVLCAHRSGRLGAHDANRRFLAWLSARIPRFVAGRASDPGRPLLVTANDPHLGLFNGDIGILTQEPGGGVLARFIDDSQPSALRPGLAPSRLPATEDVLATTIHKSQGSQFREVIVALPSRVSPIGTRELLYTAVTRASERVTILSTPELLRSAIERQVQRRSGLTAKLRG